MRGRLRALEWPSDIINQIGGWETKGVGYTYEADYELVICAN